MLPSGERNWVICKGVLLTRETNVRIIILSDPRWLISVQMRGFVVSFALDRSA